MTVWYGRIAYKMYHAQYVQFVLKLYLCLFQIGVILAFSAVIFITLSIIAIKFLATVNISVINLCFAFWGTLGCFFVSWIGQTLSIPSSDDIWKIVITALLFYLGQIFMTIALKYVDAGPVGLLRTTELVFVFLWQFLFLGVVPDVYR